MARIDATSIRMHTLLKRSGVLGVVNRCNDITGSRIVKFDKTRKRATVAGNRREEKKNAIRCSIYTHELRGISDSWLERTIAGS